MSDIVMSKNDQLILSNHTKSHKAHNVKLCIKMLIQATKDTKLWNLVSMAI